MSQPFAPSPRPHPVPLPLLVLLFCLAVAAQAPHDLLAASKSVATQRAEEVRARFNLGRIESRGRRWTSRDLNILDQSLAKLSRRERRAIRGVSFVRRRSGRGPRHTGLFRVGTGPDRIFLYDLAFRGQGKSEKANASATILHEIGHAIAMWELRRAARRQRQAVDAYNEQVRQYNQIARAHNRARGGKRDRLAKQASKLRRAMGSGRDKAVGSKRSFRKARRDARARRPRGGLLRSYQTALAGKRGPTAYGRRNLQESFAESFALFRTEPRRLKRLLPRVHAWFAAEKHLKRLPK